MSSSSNDPPTSSPRRRHRSNPVAVLLAALARRKRAAETAWLLSPLAGGTRIKPHYPPGVIAALNDRTLRTFLRLAQGRPAPILIDEALIVVRGLAAGAPPLKPGEDLSRMAKEMSPEVRDAVLGLLRAIDKRRPRKTP